MKKFFLNLQFIFRPSFWLMNHSFNKAHDKALNHLLDNHEIVFISDCRAYLGTHMIWIANYPYAVGIYNLSSRNRPSRLTILRLGKAVNTAIIEQYK